MKSAKLCNSQGTTLREYLELSVRAAFICLVWAYPPLSYSAEFSVRQPLIESLSLKGKIETGDLSRLLEASSNGRLLHGPRTLALDSPGGDIKEAMKIGKVARKLLMTCEVRTGDQCNSACFLILAGCVQRNVANVGLHRPRFVSQDFGDLSFDRASAKYRQLLESVADYLREMGISDTVVDIMTRVPSDSTRLLDSSEFQELVGVRHAAFSEWLISRCGSLTEQEKRDGKLIFWKDSWPLWRNLNFESLSPKEKKIYQWVREGFRRRHSFSDDYIDQLESKQWRLLECEQEAVYSERRLRWNSMQKSID